MSNGQLRVLVVDPDAAVRALIVALLRREGYETEAAADLEGALKRARDRAHAAVVVDPRMTGGDGLLDDLSAAAPAERPNLVVVTTPDGPIARYRSRPAVCAVVFKPFPIDELTLAVANCCHAAAREEQN